MFTFKSQIRQTVKTCLFNTFLFLFQKRKKKEAHTRKGRTQTHTHSCAPAIPCKLRFAAIDACTKGSNTHIFLYLLSGIFPLRFMWLGQLFEQFLNLCLTFPFSFFQFILFHSSSFLDHFFLVFTLTEITGCTNLHNAFNLRIGYKNLSGGEQWVFIDHIIERTEK